MVIMNEPIKRVGPLLEKAGAGVICIYLRLLEQSITSCINEYNRKK